MSPKDEKNAGKAGRLQAWCMTHVVGFEVQWLDAGARLGLQYGFVWRGEQYAAAVEVRSGDENEARLHLMEHAYFVIRRLLGHEQREMELMAEVASERAELTQQRLMEIDAELKTLRCE